MNIEEYLKSLIEFSEYPSIEHDRKQIEFEGIKNFIYKKLTSRKFRVSSISNILQNKIIEKVDYSVRRNLPIHISVPFGGYKNPNLPSFPHIDWAEVFNLIQLIEYLKPIQKYYKPGVIIEYFSDEIFIARMNNISQKDLDIYNNEFEKLINIFQTKLPSNIKLKYSKIRDFISQEELLKRFDNSIDELRKQWSNLLEEEKVLRIKKAERNYNLDFSVLDAAEKEKILLDSTLIHDAFIFSDWDKDIPWAFDKDMIPVGFRYTKDWGIPIKSSRSSTVQFWVGVGVLKQTGKGFIPSILTVEQYAKVRSQSIIEAVNNFNEDLLCLKEITIIK